MGKEVISLLFLNLSYRDMDMKHPFHYAAMASALTLMLGACATGDVDTATTGPIVASSGSVTQAQCSRWNGGEVSVNVSKAFSDGELIRDFYSGQETTVRNGKVALTPAADSEGLLLLERVDSKESGFSWDNANVYFVITDRFENGDPSNDNSYGRKPDGVNEIGTFHGGDLKGLTNKLDHIASLGTNAIWVTAPYEQVHGWTGGGIRGDFKHYAYHGYYAMDYTTMDANMGTEEDFRTFVDAAHERGIRVVMDIVMNHPGYATLQDMQEFKFGKMRATVKSTEEVLGVEEHWTDWEPPKGKNYHYFNRYINYESSEWGNWWGPAWVRAGIAGYDSPGESEQKMSLAYLPDFKTESSYESGLPNFYKNKPDTKAVEIPGYTVRQYLVKWLSDWVREYGVDGFRIDTAKHVEMDAWADLKSAGVEALAEWKANNPDKKLDDLPFWTTGEVWGHGVNKSGYFSRGGFDSIINFTYQTEDADKAMRCFSNAESTFQRYANKINGDTQFNVLSYLSSHDTRLFFHKDAKNDVTTYKRIAAPFLLLPGAVQVYYGDETARPFGVTGSDKHQGTRSDMNWDQIVDERAELLAHWQKVGQFRKRHYAIGAGSHEQISDAPYAFARYAGDDAVVVVFAGQPE
ncbi:alpha-amylase [Corallincola luteus]|uniref:Alpha-amylase n=2 Tax=Corallincola luteus TaxID=1775177 RepID=A0ABY2APF7_9GAMM|nr:alpha-amylase [Corallincola luteus]